ncbi:2Fe-2S iron-sulfur cluster-binding protein, partial [Streptomyces phaeofaciens]
RDGERPRGVFCGIGVCFDCLVTVDGRPNQRA